MLKKYYKYIIALVIVLLSIISIMIQESQRKESFSVNNKTMTASDEKIAVYITGAVVNPDVYYLDKGARLKELLDICGGVLPEADLNKVNLALKLSDSDKIDIPYVKEEIEIEVEEEIEMEDSEDSSKVNINTADIEELMTLSGIGEATAKKIIEYRDMQEFLQIEDIMQVSGIGESKFESIKDEICVN